jgi:replication factor C subunit 2/4
MAITKGEEKGESSTSAAKNILKANSNGIPNYELPWRVKAFTLLGVNTD